MVPYLCVQVVCLEFDWRAAFRVLVPQIVHGVKMFLEDVCNKSLQQEETMRSSTSRLIPQACVSLKQEAELCPERDMPKMIAQASFIYENRLHVNILKHVSGGIIR